MDDVLIMLNFWVRLVIGLWKKIQLTFVNDTNNVVTKV